MVVMPLATYEHAEVEMLKLIGEAVFRSSSLIGAISEQPTRHNSRNVSVIEPEVIEHDLLELSSDFAISHDLIRSGDVEAYTEILIEGIYSGFVIPMERHFVKVISEVTRAAGNTVNAAEEGLSPFDAILKALETIEMSLDDDGHLVFPTIAANRDTLEQISDGTLSESQRESINSLLNRKHQELLRNRKVRRLVAEVELP